MQTSLTGGEGLPARYRVLARLGRGAFAEAYHCEDTEAGREVVVKVYELRERAWSLLTSFEREAAVLAELAHPAIPRYVAHAQLPDGRLMLVQSFAPGRSLLELLREGRRFTDREVADIAEQVLGVLDYLQSFNPPIIHRDIKPANLLLDEQGRVRIVDFGSVKASFRREQDSASTMAGTFGYMAPEQFQGRATIQSDLYGLGATLVHVLSHLAPTELPQDGLKLDFHDRIKASAGTVTWLDRMLEPDPRLRFASAQQALAAFRARDSIARATSPSPLVLARLAPPHGSRITVSEQDGELQLTLPGQGFSGLSVGRFLFALVSIGFMVFWTTGAARASFTFALFSLPFWGFSLWAFGQALFVTFGVATLRIGRYRYSLHEELWAYQRDFEGPTRQLEGASLGFSGTRVNGRRVDYCVLHVGVRDVKFGTQLGLVERRWVVERINQHLGVEPRATPVED